MTVPLSANSPRGLSAKRFGAELRRAMLARKVGAHRLADAAGVARSAIANWKAGGNLPRLDTAAKFAEVLDWPALVAISRAGRTLTCARCRREFVNNGGAPARFCSVACRDIDEQLRRPAAGAELAQSLRDTLSFRAGMRGGVPKLDLEQALVRYARSDSRRVQRTSKLEQQVAGLQELVNAMCAGCEPAGMCRTPECSLRPASPLTLQVTEARGEIVPVEGPWGPSNREAQLVAIRAANAERWARPGERERASAATRARWDAMSDEERVRAGRVISVARRAS